jgi:hypothetical protein
MSDLDRVLIELSKKQSIGLSDKNKIPMSDDLRLKKVAFDMYKVFGDQYDDLWKVEVIEGDSFLIRSSDPQFQKKEGGDWSASSNYDYDNVTLSYKNVPICAFSSEDYGFDNDDIFTFKAALLDMASSDIGFLKKVIGSQAKAKVSAIESIFPDMFKDSK